MVDIFSDEEVHIFFLFKAFLLVLSPMLSHISKHCNPKPCLLHCKRTAGQWQQKARRHPSGFCNSRQVCKGHLVTVIPAADSSNATLHPSGIHFPNLSFYLWMFNTLQPILKVAKKKESNRIVKFAVQPSAPALRRFRGRKQSRGFRKSKMGKVCTHCSRTRKKASKT